MRSLWRRTTYRIPTKIMKTGSVYAFRIPKALVDCRVLDIDCDYVLRVEKVKKTGQISGPFLNVVKLLNIFHSDNNSCSASV